MSRCSRAWRKARGPHQRSAAVVFPALHPCAAGFRARPTPLVLGKRPRDDDPLNLARAFEQGVDLGVAVPLLDREVADVAVAPADLDRLLGDLDGDLAGLELRHRTLGLLELAAVATFPQRAPDERASGPDLGRHVREHEGDRFVFDQRATELLALLRVGKRELKRRARDAKRLRADDRARELEGLERDR